MAKGPVITDKIEALIASVHRKHPKWKAPTLRNEVDFMLHTDNPELPTGWPGLSSVQKVLASVRRKDKEPSPEDKPWSTATLDSYPIPPEALPVVLKVWKLCIEKGQGFTIREAKWAARLSALEQDTEGLFFTASRHARTELMFELIGRPFDSTELDRSLMGLPVEASDFQSFLWLLAETREDPERGIKDGIEQVKDHIKEKNQKGGKSK